jgi:uncharacterized protein
MIRIISLVFLSLFISMNGFTQSKGVKKKKANLSRVKKQNQTSQIDSIKIAKIDLLNALKNDSIIKIIADSAKAVVNRLNQLETHSSFRDSNSLSHAANKTQLFQNPIGWVNDFEKIFTEEENLKLDSILSKFEKKTSNEIAIVTIDSSWITKEKFDSLTLVIANKWGVGKKENNNGILIGISKGLRKIRIQNGKGIVPKLSDKETKLIIDNYFIPEFKNGNYFKGCFAGILEIMRKIR